MAVSASTGPNKLRKKRKPARDVTPPTAMSSSSASSSSSSRPAHHAGTPARPAFRNPWTSAPSTPTSSASYAEWLRARAQSLPGLEWAREHPAAAHIGPLAVVQPDFAPPGDGELKATWLGHAGYLVQLDKDTAIVFDPIFSERAGPAAAQGAYAVGPARFAPAPCKVDELPDNVRFVVISHNHYDHLDLATILGIHAKQGKRVTYLVPLGNKPWFTSCGIGEDQVHELDWWESFEPPVAMSDHTADSALSRTLKFTCVPAQHSSGRSLTDQRATLWGGWVVELFSTPARSPSASEQDITDTSAARPTEGRRLASVYHAGDTGYATPRGPAPFFAEIGARFGPLDLALVPVWRGGSLGFVAALGLRLVHAPNTHSPLSQLHASPSEARSIARDVRARHALAMHFGTFVGSALEAREPLVELALLRRRELRDAPLKIQNDDVGKNENQGEDGEGSKNWGEDGKKNKGDGGSKDGGGGVRDTGGSELARTESDGDGSLGPGVQVRERPALSDEGGGGGGGAGGWLWGKRPAVLRRLTAPSTTSVSKAAQEGATEVEEGEMVEGVGVHEDEAGRWADEGGFGWVDIGGSAVVPLQ